MKKAEDTETDTAEQSALKLRTQQQSSNALVVTDQRSANGSINISELSLVSVPKENVVRKLSYVLTIFAVVSLLITSRNIILLQDLISDEQSLANTNGTVDKVRSDPIPSADVIGDLLSIEGPPSTTIATNQNLVSGLDVVTDLSSALALSTISEESNSVQVIGICDFLDNFFIACLSLHSFLQTIGNIVEMFHTLCIKDSGVLYEDPYIQVFFCKTYF